MGGGDIESLVLQISRQALVLVLLLSGIPIVISMIVGVFVSVFQAATQIQEQTLSFIPKIAGLAVVLVVGGPWMLGQLITWTEGLYAEIPKLVGG